MKTIKFFALILFAAVFFRNTSLQAAQANDGRQARQLSGFHGISVSGGIDLYLTQQNAEEVFVEADPEDMDKIITRVAHGILKISVKDKSWWGTGSNKRQRKVFVSFKTLDKLQVSAGSDVKAASVLKLDKLRLDVSSRSEVKLELDVRELNVESSSRSDISLKGVAEVIEASASGGSDINAGELKSEKCTARVSNGSEIKVHVTKKLEASASSRGDITYSGDPKTKEIRETSGGDVKGR